MLYTVEKGMAAWCLINKVCPVDQRTVEGAASVSPGGLFNLAQAWPQNKGGQTEAADRNSLVFWWSWMILVHLRFFQGQAGVSVRPLYGGQAMFVVRCSLGHVRQCTRTPVDIFAHMWPVLRVTRKQFPLAPNFATTAHAAQGQTRKEGVVMDMHIGEAGDPLTAYIAITRVQDRHGLFVYRPFPAAPFQKGEKVGRALLLRFWAGEEMDWSALRKKYRDEKQCKECNESKPTSAFTAGRWKREDAARVCKECIRRHVEAQQPWQCMACTAWKQEDAFMAKHAKPQATFHRICTTCEATQVCTVCKVRKDENKFSTAAWKRARHGSRVCLDCGGKAWGWWRCSVCKVKEAAPAFESWLAQNGSCNGDQICKNCWTSRIPRKSISRALERVAATQAKVAATAVEEKKARVIAEVRAAIAEKKRTRDADGSQTQGAEPKAKQRREEGREEMTIANAQDPITEQKRRREVDEAEAQEGEPKEKQRKDKAGKAEEKHKALKAGKRQEGNKASKEKTLPANTRHATQRGKSFQYVCPACHQSVISSIRTGQVNHRRTCGHQFQVKDGVVAEKSIAYTCPFCKGLVNSNVKTGKINHRGVCGYEFAVQDGVVAKKSFVYQCPFCNGLVNSNVKTGNINHRGVCGYKFSVRDGVVAKKSFVYQCPFCNGLVNSNVKTGQINHRSVCNNQFYVKDGEVSKQTRRHTHSCPVCSTVVWSSLSCGRIAVTHDMPSGKPCHKKQWHVPEKKTTKTKKK